MYYVRQFKKLSTCMFSRLSHNLGKIFTTFLNMYSTIFKPIVFNGRIMFNNMLWGSIYNYFVNKYQFCIS